MSDPFTLAAAIAQFADLTARAIAVAARGTRDATATAFRELVLAAAESAVSEVPDLDRDQRIRVRDLLVDLVLRTDARVWLAVPTPEDPRTNRQLLESNLEAAGASSGQEHDVVVTQVAALFDDFRRFFFELLAADAARAESALHNFYVVVATQELLQRDRAPELPEDIARPSEALLLSLPPSVPEHILQLHSTDETAANRLIESLADAKQDPRRITEQLVNLPPPWLSEAPASAWIALGEYAESHNAFPEAARCFEAAAERGGDRAHLLARAALRLGESDPAGSEQLLRRSRALDASNPFLRVCELALARARSRDDEATTTLEDLVSACDAAMQENRADILIGIIRAVALAQLGRLDDAVEALEALRQSNPASSGVKLRLAELLIEQSTSEAAIERGRGLAAAQALALDARDLRRAWRGPSSGAVATACHAAAAAEDWDEVFRRGLPQPQGQATVQEASDPAVRSLVALAALATGNTALADDLISRLSDGFDRLSLTAMRAAVEPDRRDEAISLFLEAWDLARDPLQRERVQRGLAALGHWPVPGLEELRRTNQHQAVVFEALAAKHGGEIERAVALLRPASADSRLAAMLLAQIELERGRPDEALAIVTSGSQRFNEPTLLEYASRLFLASDAVLQAKTAASRALPRFTVGSPQRAALHRLLIELAQRENDARRIEELCQAALAEGDDAREIRFALAFSQIAQFRAEDALNTLRRPPALQPETDSEALVWLQAHLRSDRDSDTTAEVLDVARRFATSERVVGAALLWFYTGEKDDTELREEIGQQVQALASEFLERFPESKIFWAVQIDTSDPRRLRELIKPDVEQERRVRTAHEHVAAVRLPIGLFSRVVHRNLLEVLSRLPIIPIVSADAALLSDEARAIDDARNQTVVLDTATLYIGAINTTIMERLMGTFHDCLLEQHAREDLEVSIASRPPSGFLGWDLEADEVQLSDLSSDERQAWDETRARINGFLRHVTIVNCDGLTEFPDFDVEDHGVWLGALQVAKNRGCALWSDDLALRLLARSIGVPAFGTFSLITRLRESGDITDSEFLEAIKGLYDRGAVDLPFSHPGVVEIARQTNWKPVPLAKLMSRPGFWQLDVPQAFETYGTAHDRVRQEHPDEAAILVNGAALGLARSSLGVPATQRIADLLALTILSTSPDFSHVPTSVAAARAASAALDLPDPLPLAVPAIHDAVKQRLSAPDAATFVVHTVFADLEPEDRRRVLLSLLQAPDEGV